MAKFIFYAIWLFLVGLAATSLGFTALLIKHGLYNEIPLPLSAGIASLIMAMAARRVRRIWCDATVVEIPKEFRVQ